MWNKSAQGGEGSGGEGRVLLKCRSGDLLCFAARHSHVPISCLTPPLALGACYYIFLLSENGFISPLLSPAPSLPFHQIVFCPLIAPPLLSSPPPPPHPPRLHHADGEAASGDKIVRSVVILPTAAFRQNGGGKN